MSKLNPPDVSRMGADELRRWNMFMTQERESTKEFLHSARDADLVKIGVIPETVPPSRRRRYLLENMESVVDDYQKLYPFGQVRPIEDLWYQELKVLLPPEELRSRHPGFDDAWRTIVTQKNLDRTLRREVRAAYSQVANDTTDTEVGPDSHQRGMEAECYSLCESILLVHPNSAK